MAGHASDDVSVALTEEEAEHEVHTTPLPGVCCCKEARKTPRGTQQSGVCLLMQAN